MELSPSEEHATLGSGPRVKTCSSSYLSWLHPLRSWSLRQTRGGSKNSCCRVHYAACLTLGSISSVAAGTSVVTRAAGQRFGPQQRAKQSPSGMASPSIRRSTLSEAESNHHRRIAARCKCCTCRHDLSEMLGAGPC